MHVLIGTDGSDDAINAARHALPLLATADVVTLVCVVEPPAEVSAGLESGFAGGVVAPDVLGEAWAAADDYGAQRLGANGGGDLRVTAGSVELVVESGGAGPILCDLVVERGRRCRGRRLARTGRFQARPARLGEHATSCTTHRVR